MIYEMYIARVRMMRRAGRHDSHAGDSGAPCRVKRAWFSLRIFLFMIYETYIAWVRMFRRAVRPDLHSDIHAKERRAGAAKKGGGRRGEGACRC